MEPNWVAIETSLSEMMALPTEEGIANARKFRAALVKMPAVFKLLGSANNGLRAQTEEELFLRVLLNVIAMSVEIGWNAGCGSAEGKMLEELFR